MCSLQLKCLKQLVFVFFPYSWSAYDHACTSSLHSLIVSPYCEHFVIKDMVQIFLIHSYFILIHSSSAEKDKQKHTTKTRLIVRYIILNFVACFSCSFTQYKSTQFRNTVLG